MPPNPAAPSPDAHASHEPVGIPSDASTSTVTTSWAVIVPLKQTSRGKSRLAGLTTEQRRDLALAFTLDAVTAAVATVAVDRVVVVTNDPEAAAFESIGAEVIDDRPDAGLNPAFVHGAHHVAHEDPTAGLLALAGDLPCLTTDVLGSVLRAAPPGRWFVADAVGTGTTVLAATNQRLSPSFGPHSRAAHRASGATEVDLPGLARLRRDVDTEVDLWDAVRLGVGAHTQRALSRHGLVQLP